VPADSEPYVLLERVFREEAGRLTASLVRLLGDFDLAEEMVSEAMLEALEHWPRDGVPERASSWLLTTAKRKGLDRLWREAKHQEKLALLAALGLHAPRLGDDRLQLIFTCCHPVLAREAQIALTLRAVAGLTTDEIARAFHVAPETMARRITRAKRKIAASRVPFRVPPVEDIAPRLREVLTVIYLIFNEGYVVTSGTVPIRRDVASDAEWLATLLMRLMPDQPEVMGLVALIRLHLARWAARLDAEGQLVLLEFQDRTLWDRNAIRDAIRLIERAATLHKPGPYQIEASIAALHCEALTWEQTDWRQILALYSVLAAIDPSPIVRLNRAVAMRHVEGLQPALSEVEALAGALSHYHLFHATRAALLRELGRPAEADQADLAGIQLTKNTAERNVMLGRLAAR
jgi:predicted RNA polymerase sigma factor